MNVQTGFYKTSGRDLAMVWQQPAYCVEWQGLVGSFVCCSPRRKDWPTAFVRRTTSDWQTPHARIGQGRFSRWTLTGQLTSLSRFSRTSDENGFEFFETKSVKCDDDLLVRVDEKDPVAGKPSLMDVIVESPEWSYHYAVYILKNRWVEAEPAISASSFKLHYVNAFPCVKGEWLALGLLDWLEPELE
jgi:hypothetical protein